MTMDFKTYTSPYKDQLFGYEFRFFMEKTVWKSYLKQIEKYKLSISFRNTLELIFRSRFWETRGFDGKTFIKDRYAGHISVFFHDYPSRMGFGCKENDVIFWYLELASGTSKPWAKIQYSVVRLATPLFTLRDYIRGRRQPKPQWLKDLYIEVVHRMKVEHNIVIK